MISPKLKNRQPSPPKPTPVRPAVQSDGKPVTCNACGATGHKAFQCRKRGRGAGKESTQRQFTRAVNALATDGTSEVAAKQEKVVNLR